MMVSQLDTTHYNQVAGKEMTAWFRDNEIYRDDVNGNAQTIYYMQDGEPPQITGMGVIESGDARSYRGQADRDDRLPQGSRVEHLPDGEDPGRSGLF